MKSDPGFKADAVAFQEVQRLYPGGQVTPRVIKERSAIVQTDIDQADEPLGALRTIVKAELAHEGHQGYTTARSWVGLTILACFPCMVIPQLLGLHTHA
jgi:hypothetical protein